MLIPCRPDHAARTMLIPCRPDHSARTMLIPCRPDHADTVVSNIIDYNWLYISYHGFIFCETDSELLIHNYPDYLFTQVLIVSLETLSLSFIKSHLQVTNLYVRLAYQRVQGWGKIHIVQFKPWHINIFHIFQHDSHMIHTWFTHDSHMIHTWFTHDSHMIHTWFTHDSHMIHTWFTHDSHMIH